MAEKEVFDIQTNPYFLSQDSIDELNMEIEELKVLILFLIETTTGRSEKKKKSKFMHSA